MRAGAIDRRNLLKASGAIVVAFAVRGFAAQGAVAAERGKRQPLAPDQLDSFVAIDRDGRCTVFFGKVDVGQGVQVAIAQIVAEELDLPLSAVDVIMGDTAFTLDQGGASGSYAISNAGRTLRFAAAEARRVLVERAAAALETFESLVETGDGKAWVRGSPERALTYGELIGEGYFETPLTWNGQMGNRLDARGKAVPKSPDQYKVVGTSPPREDIRENVFGDQAYVTDVRVPGMLHARVIRPPVVGSVPLAINPQSIARFNGARAIHERGIVAVFAEREWDAIRASRVLEVQWSEAPPPFPDPEQLYDYLDSAPTERSGDEESVGDFDAVVAAGERVVEARYEWPFQSHASMAAACAVADVKDASATVWTGTQKPHAVRTGVAKLLGLPDTNVRAIWVRGPGSYGRNDAGDAALEAAFLSRVVGRPVRLQYTRAQGTGWDPKGPASIHRCRGLLSSDGWVLGLSLLSRGFSRMDVAPTEADPRDTLVGQLLGKGSNSQAAFAIPDEPYEPAAKRFSWETVAPLVKTGSSLRTGHLRDPVGLQINFASESFWDEMAYAASADPVAFRLRHLKDPRAITVLQETARLFGWKPRVAGNPDDSGETVKGQGIAVCSRGDTLCATAVEIELNRRTGRIRPVRWAIAHDCGLVINPAGLKLVIEGNIIQATSRSLYEEVSFNRSNVTSVDWMSYPIADVTDMPDRIDIALINRPEHPPGGAGEPAGRPVPAALANALFDAAGIRLRRAPLTPARVKAALEASDEAQANAA